MAVVQSALTRLELEQRAGSGHARSHRRGECDRRRQREAATLFFVWQHNGQLGVFRIGILQKLGTLNFATHGVDIDREHIIGQTHRRQC